MTCLVCNESLCTHINDKCFSLTLNSLRLHYDYLNEILKQRNDEIQRLQKQNEKLSQFVELCQPEKKCFKKSSPGRDTSNIELSSSDDDIISGPNLNVALNSELLFDTSDLSPPPGKLDRTSSELITSPRIQNTPKRKKKQHVLRPLNDSNEQVSKQSDSLLQETEKYKSTSWAASFLKPKVSSIKTREIGAKTGKKLCLSLKKTHSSKVKQTIIDNYKKTKLSDSTFCEEIIEASPVLEKTTIKDSKSWLLQRTNNNHSISESDANLNLNSSKSAVASKNSGPAVSIDQIVFDFSPTKKADISLADENTPVKITPISWHSTKECTEVQKSSKDLINLPNSLSSNNSSVIMLTPTTQDIIFIDDDNLTNIDTMDFVKVLQQNDTSTIKAFYKYESKCIEKYQNENRTGALNVGQTKSDHQFQLPKPGSFIKFEKCTQNDVSKIETTPKPNEDEIQEDERLKKSILTENNQKQKDYYNDDDDCIPKPIQVKKEKEEDSLDIINIKETYNIDCQKCEQYIKFFGHHLTKNEIEDHLNKCVIHNRQQLNNTPEGFWNPLIMSFPTDDTRNQVLIDSRLKDKKRYA